MWKRDDVFRIVVAAYRGTAYLSGTHRGDETIAPAGDCFDVPGIFGIISESVANLFYAEIKTAFEIHEGVRAPKSLLKFLAVDNLPRATGKKVKHSKGLGMKLQQDSVFS